MNTLRRGELAEDGLPPEESLKLMRLRNANPSAVALAETLSLRGSTLDAIASNTGLGIAPINRILAQKVPSDVLNKLSRSALGAQIPVGTHPTYGDVRGLMHSRREVRLVQVADGASQLRALLLQRAAGMVEQGTVSSWRDLMSGLRVLGVPNAGNVSDVDRRETARPPQFHVDEQGASANNPAYTQWLTKNAAANVQAVNLVIGLDLLAQGGTAGLGAKPLTTDEDGNITTLVAQGVPKSLVSMEATEIHKLAYGVDATLMKAKAAPLVTIEDLI